MAWKDNTGDLYLTDPHLAKVCFSLTSYFLGVPLKWSVTP